MTSESNNSNSKLPLSIATLPVLSGVPRAGGPLHPQVMADVLAGRERYGAELLALGAAHAAPGGPGADADPNQLEPEVDMTKVEERHLAVSRSDVQEEDKEEVNLSGRELRLLLHLGAMSARLQRKFMPQLGDANTVRDLRKLLTVIKDIAASADESTLELLSTVGLTVLDSVLRNDEFTAVVEQYALLLQEAVAAGGPIPSELRKAPAKFAPKMHVHFYFRVFKQTWDFSFGEGSVQVDVRFELAHRVVVPDKGGVTEKDKSDVDNGNDNANLDDQASPLDKTFDAADCVQLPLGPAAGGQVAMLPPDAYAVLEDGTTVCNSSAVAGIPLVRRARESHFCAAGRCTTTVPSFDVALHQQVGAPEHDPFVVGTKGSPGTDPGTFQTPYQTAVDVANERILVAEDRTTKVGARMRVLGLDGQHRKWLSVEGLEKGRSGVAVDPDSGIIAISANDIDQVLLLHARGFVLHKMSHSDLKAARQVVIASVGGSKEVYVASYSGECIVVFDLDGKYVRSIKLSYGPYGVAVGPDELVYVSNYISGSVEVYTPTGEHVRQHCNGLTKPYEVSINSKGYVAVGSYGTHVTVFSPYGTVLYEGRECNEPRGVEWYNDRQLLVCISTDHQIELLNVPGME